MQILGGRITLSDGWYPGKILNRLLPKESPQGKPLRFYYYYEMQDKLIEHKYPTVGVTELAISHAGDIYRAMTIHAWQELNYIYEKWGRLEKYIRKGYIPRQEYDEEIKRQINSPEYRQKVLKYMDNLELLIQKTSEISDKPMKDVLLASLNLIIGLIKWYETSYENVPTKQFDLLTEKLGHFFPEWREK